MAGHGRAHTNNVALLFTQVGGASRSGRPPAALCTRYSIFWLNFTVAMMCNKAICTLMRGDDSARLIIEMGNWGCEWERVERQEGGDDKS